MRILLVTLLATLLSFAVGLLLGILGTVIGAKVHGVAPDMRLAYRYVALPTAVAVGAIVTTLMTALEIRHYRRAKVLADLERAA